MDAFFASWIVWEPYASFTLASWIGCGACLMDLSKIDKVDCGVSQNSDGTNKKRGSHPFPDRTTH
eukprot:5231877-Amphidinium_carterae.1